MKNARPASKSSRVLWLTFVFLSAISAVRAESFTLTDKQGRVMNADVLSVDGDKARIKRDDGQAFTIAISNLSEDDQKKVRKWAEKESAKPLAADAIEIELSRGLFKTEKRDIDVTLTSGEKIKNGRSITEEKWGYGITVINRTPQRLETLRIEYRLFATVDNVHSTEDKQGLKKKAYKSPITAVPELGRVVFRTETISAIKSKYNGNIVSAKSGESTTRETLYGIWMRIYHGDELVHESAMPESLRTTEKW